MRSQQAYGCLVAIGALVSGASAAADRSQYLEYALNASTVLNDVWYNKTTGLYSNRWWSTGNSITTLAHLTKLNPEAYTSEFSAYWETTYANAPNEQGASNFINGYYDDEGWWAMAWIDVYDVTGDSKYLNTAASIFDDMAGGWGTPCGGGGGIWWDKAHTAKASIANELFLEVASYLAFRIPSRKAYYENWADQEYDFLTTSGLIDSNHTVYDSFDTKTCKLLTTVWSYNQGAILAGLAVYSALKENATILTLADNIATAAMAKLDNANGTLVDPDGLKPGADGAQFKGVFLRGLQRLYQAAPNSTYKAFIQHNADSIVANDASGGMFGPNWEGPYEDVSAASQSSALDCFVAAAYVS